MLGESTSYDVFISYDSLDHALGEPIAERLRQEHFNVFLDRWYLTPGLSWVDRLAAAMGWIEELADLDTNGNQQFMLQHAQRVLLELFAVGDLKVGLI